MQIESLHLIIFVVGLSVGHYTIFSIYLTRGFVQRFKEFKSSFDEWMKEEVAKLSSELQKRIEESTDELIDFIIDWTYKAVVVRDIMQEYYELNKITKQIIFVLGCAAIFAFLEIADPAPKRINGNVYYWIYLARFLTFLGVTLIFYYLWKFHILNSRIARFELGVSVEEIIEEEIAKREG